MSRSVAFLWGGAVLLCLAVAPWAPLLEGSLWTCTFKSWTGFACPTCGTSRAALALARLDFGTALTRYPLPAVGFILFLVGGLAASGTALAGRTPPPIPNRIPVWLRFGLVAAVLANWAYAIATGV